MQLISATLEDIPFITGLERELSAQGFIRAWPLDLHRAALADPDCRYLIFADNPGSRDGFAILRGLAGEDRAIELKRIAVALQGRGIGRRALEAIMAEVFESVRAHRLWLDTYEDNARALHVYAALGFRREGVLREAAKRADGYKSLVLFSLLEDEWRARRRS